MTVSEAVNDAVDKLASVALKRALELHGFSHQVELMQLELNLIKGFLKDADSKCNTDLLVKEWANKLSIVAYMINDTMDSFLFENIKLNKSQVPVPVSTTRSLKHNSLSAEIERITQMLKALNEHANQLGIKASDVCVEDISRSPVRPTITEPSDTDDSELVISRDSDKRRSSSNITVFSSLFSVATKLAQKIYRRQKGKKSCEQSGKEALEWDIQSAPPNLAISFIGRENEKESIIELLMQHEVEECNSCRVICTVGEIGSGKTAVARAVYDDSRVLDTFDVRIFVSMSHRSNEKHLMKAIMEAITETSCEITEPDILDTIIKEEFAGKRFLIVLDEATSENKGSLNVLRLLNSSEKGSVVLITTSSRTIADDVTGSEMVYNLNLLSESCCLEIIKSIAFERKDPNTMDGFIWICKELVNRSGHTPLCLKVLGGLLKKLNPEKWIAVLESDWWRNNKFSGGIFPALRVCYEYLPTILKRCFSYFSLFPENYVFKKSEVICLWLSQGFIEPIEGKEPEDIGDEYFDELLERFFIEESPIGPEVGKFVMHGKIHDLVKHVAVYEYLSSEDHMQRIPENIRHFSFVPNEFQTLPTKYTIAEAKNLQSFLVLSRSPWNTICTIANLMDLRDLIMKFTNLRSLSLSNTAIEELPDFIGSLQNLSYLGLNNTRIKSLPPEISCLTKLLSLEAANCYLLDALPGTIKELINLRHLDVTKDWGYVEMPVGIGGLSNLRSLPAFNVGSDPLQSSISELKSLDLLRGSLQISGLENVASVIATKEANLAGKFFLEKISLQWSPHIDYTTDENDDDFVGMVLDNLKPCYNLHALVISNYMGSKFPTWMEDASYSKLESVILDNCPSCDTFPAFGSLPLLKYLSVQKLYDVREIRALGKFPSLQLLNLRDMYELEIFEVNVGDFPSLHTLSISRCHKLKFIPCIPSLVHLTLHFCSEVPDIPELPLLKYLKVEGFNKIEVLHLPVNLPVLKNVEIVNCGELRLLEDISKLMSIEKVKIIKCPKLDLNVNWGRHHFKRESGAGICINLVCQTLTVGASFKLSSSTALTVQKGDIRPKSISGYTGVIVNSTNETMLGGGGLDGVSSNSVNSSRKGSSPAGTPSGSLRVPPSPSRFSLSSHSSRMEPVHLSLSQIARMTHKFSSAYKIGEGYFGTVFKGELADGRFIAIKRAKKHLASLSAEFRNEAALLSKIKHKNLVQLLGYVEQGNERIIITEYVPNGTLREHLDGM